MSTKENPATSGFPNIPKLPRGFVMPSLAIVGVLVTTVAIISRSPSPAPAVSIAKPAEASYPSTIAGAGLVEPSSENIAIGSNLAGIVARVAVQAGSVVRKGDPLFTLDDRAALAEHGVRAAAVALAIAQRSEAQTQWRFAIALSDPRALSRDERERRRHALDIAEARVKGAEAALGAISTDIERLTVNAPIDGTVLQVNTRVGESVTNIPGAPPIMILGDTRELHVRVDIDENDSWRFLPGAPAKGFIKGNSSLNTELRFVRVEPYIIPKRSLTGGTTERVDTRVLQVLYAFTPDGLDAYIGQQLDVFIEAKSGE